MIQADVRTALITGCSDGGLGAALAMELHRRGYHVFATARKLEKMQALTEAGIQTLALDVCSEASLQQAFDSVSSACNHLTVLINNAGAGYFAPIIEAKAEEIDALFTLNVTALVRTTQVFMPLLLKTKRGAMIVNNTSAASLLHLPWSGVYNATKAAAAMISENMRIELESFSISVFDLKTGGVQSNFYDNMATRTGPNGGALAPNSLYAGIQDEIEGYKRGNLATDFMDAATWARQVIGDLEKASSSRLVFRGSGSFGISMSRFTPRFLLDYGMRRMSGLNKLAMLRRGSRTTAAA